MRHTGLAARIVFAERFTNAVIDRPFYAGLRMIAARPRMTPATEATPVAEPTPAPAPLPVAA